MQLSSLDSRVVKKKLRSSKPLYIPVLRNLAVRQVLQIRGQPGLKWAKNPNSQKGRIIKVTRTRTSMSGI